MAKVRSGKLGSGGYIGPSGKSIFGNHIKIRSNKPYDPTESKLSIQQKKLLKEKSNIKNKNAKIELFVPNEYFPKIDKATEKYSAIEYVNAYEKIKDLDKFFKAVIESKVNQAIILQIVKNRILERQTDADNSLIKRNYPTSRVVKTNWYKGKDNGEYEHRYNLYDSGEFFNTLYVVYEKNNVLIKSNSFKRQTIIEAYGENAYQLTTKDVENINKALDVAIQYYFDRIKYKPSGGIF